MKIEITITPNYVPDWSLFEGVREFLQNAKDGETEHSSSFKVEHNKKTLKITNKDITLPKESLLIGYTSKHSPELLGKFGEGMKLGALALVRAGYEVKITNGDEIWIPSLQKSKSFSSDVLIFSTRKLPNPKKDFIVEIYGISSSEWAVMKKNYLFITPPGEKLISRSGEILLSEEYKGKVFLKGIYVETTELSYGYNLYQGEVDRDRKMMRRFNLYWEISNLWAANITDNLEIVEDLLKNDSSEVKNIDTFLFPDDFSLLADSFKSKYGSNAYPVYSEDSFRQLQVLNGNPIRLNENYTDCLRRALPSFADYLSSLAQAPTKFYNDDELSEKELMLIAQIYNLAAKVISVPHYYIVDFADPDVSGQRRDGEIYISKKCLSDKSDLIATFVHESCHLFGGDLSQTFHQIVEQTLAQIICNLMEEL